MRLVAAHTSVPVPRILDVITNIGEEPHYKGIILMTWIEGAPLSHWLSDYTIRTPESIALTEEVDICFATNDFGRIDELIEKLRAQPDPILDMPRDAPLLADLRRAFDSLRSIPAPSDAITDVNGGPVRSIRDGSTKVLGPFDNQGLFKDALLNMAGGAVAHRVPELRRLAIPVHAMQHRIFFTHGDLHSENIIVKDGRLAGIVDWEYAGWFPEYWEFTMLEKHIAHTPVSQQFWDTVAPFGVEPYRDELQLEYALWLCTGDTTIVGPDGDDLVCPR